MPGMLITPGHLYGVGGGGCRETQADTPFTPQTAGAGGFGLFLSQLPTRK